MHVVGDLVLHSGKKAHISRSNRFLKMLNMNCDGYRLGYIIEIQLKSCFYLQGQSNVHEILFYTFIIQVELILSLCCIFPLKHITF